jgi:rhamnosyltransferase
MNSVSSVIICFYPDIVKVNKLINIIEASVDQIIVINNGGLDANLLANESGKVRVESRGENLGIATALNIGCDIAIKSGCRFIVSFDQDSTPEKSMIPNLVQEYLVCESTGQKVAAVGPQLMDVRSGLSVFIPFVKFTSYWYEEWVGEGTQPVSQLITSGCLVNLSAWADGNKFNEELFIDFVDNNWCWRVVKKGYLVLGTNRARMAHEISDQIKKANRYSLNKYGPTRRYFQSRNAVHHLIYEDLLLAQKFYVLKSLVVMFASVLFFDKNRVQSFGQCIRGFVHGLMNILGPYSKK